MKTKLTKLCAVLVFNSLNAFATTHYVDLNSPSPALPHTNWLTAATNIQDAINVASAGDLILVTNGTYEVGGTLVSGMTTNRIAVTIPVAVQSFSGAEVTIIRGHQVPLTVLGSEAVRCVYLTNGASLVGFTLTQGATVDGESGGGVLCENTSAVISNCVLQGNSADAGGACFLGTLVGCSIRSNFALGTGGGANSSVLINCELRDNSAGADGGGAFWSELYNSTLSSNTSGTIGGGASGRTASNCTFVGNSASSMGGGGDTITLKNCRLISNSAGSYGGGAEHSTLDGCTLMGNTAGSAGGGAAGCDMSNCLLFGNAAGIGGGAATSSLNNCTVVSNAAASSFGGVYSGYLNNCIVYYNSAPLGNNYDWLAVSGISNNCVEPLPASVISGDGNFTNAPLFVELAAGNLRLQSNSPCINAGINLSLVGTNDLDGRRRVVDSVIDVGVYEFQGAGIGEFIGWLQSSGLPTDGSADFADPDADGMNNYGEWRSDTIPTNALSVLRMVSATNSPTGGNVTWQSVATRSYWLERATNLGVASPFESVATNIAGAGGTNTYTDGTATNGGPYFYRVGVQ